MKPLSSLTLLSLLNGALAGINDLASGCTVTKVLPTVTTGCSENLSLASKDAGHSAPWGAGSHTPEDSEPQGANHPGTTSLDVKPSQPTSSESGHGSNHRPIVNGQPDSNTSSHVPGSTDTPKLVSGAPGMVAIRNEMAAASLLASFAVILMGYM